MQPLQDGVHRRQLVGVLGEIEADGAQPIAYVHRRHRYALPSDEPDGVGQTERDGRGIAEQPVQRADRLRELRQPIVDLAATVPERFVLADGGGERRAVVPGGHRLFIHNV